MTPTNTIGIYRITRVHTLSEVKTISFMNTTLFFKFNLEKKFNYKKDICPSIENKTKSSGLIRLGLKNPWSIEKSRVDLEK
jgi:hypothetical protein